MRYLYLLLVWFIFSNPVLGFENVSIPQNDYQNSFEQTSAISSEEFNDIEKQIFKKTFPNDSSKNRLSRLEKEIFGMEQQGSEEERFENIMTAYEYYQAGYRKDNNENKPQQYYSYDNSQKLNSKNFIQNYNFSDVNNPKSSANYNDSEVIQKPSKIKVFFDNIIDTFSTGAMTGYTPSIIDPFSNFSTIPNYYGSSYMVPRHYAPNYYRRPYYNSPQYNYVRPHYHTYSRPIRRF